MCRKHSAAVMNARLAAIAFFLAIAIAATRAQSEFDDFRRTLEDEMAEDNLLDKLRKSFSGEGEKACKDVLNPTLCVQMKNKKNFCAKPISKKFCFETCGCGGKSADAKRVARTFPPIPPPAKRSGEDQETITDTSADVRTFPPIPPPSKRSDDDYPKEEENAMAQITDVNQKEDLDLHESDIMLAPEREEDAGLTLKDQLSKRNAVQDKGFLWPHRKVPYILTESIGTSGSRFDAIIAAMREIETKTCVRFIPRKTESNYLSFFKGRGCWSYVGRVYYKSGPQNVSIGDGCQYKGTAVHEMLHAIGFSHEQSRSDRDTYVEIMWENIMDGKEGNFEKMTNQRSKNYVNYDYGSIMHYGSHYFTKNGKATMKALGAPANTFFGQRNEMSTLDATEVNALYHCADAKDTASGWSKWSSYSPCNSVCYKRRQRFCTGETATADCKNADDFGIINDFSLCSPTECNAPLNGGWSMWQAWTQCSVTCDGGSRTRARKCTDPAPAHGGSTCSGDSAQSEKCTVISCDAGPYDSTFDSPGWEKVWTLEVTENSGWFKKTAGTPSSGTGPSGDHTTGSESYVYYESSYPSKTGERRKISSTELPSNAGGKRCVSFWYHMFGSSMGSLIVYTSLPYKEVWTLSGDQGNTWKQAQVTIDADHSLQVGFIAVRGLSFRGDIALDDIIITEKACGNAARATTEQRAVTTPTTKAITKPAATKCSPSTALGMGSGAIKNYQLSATSSMDSYHTPHHARLNGSSAWCAGTYQDYSSHHLQVDFVSPTIVSGIITEDLPVHPYNDVQEYYVQYSADGYSFQFYKENGVKELISASHYNGRRSTFVLAEPIIALVVRIIPHMYSGEVPCLRLELLGCAGPQPKRPSGCSADIRALGVSSGAILDKSITSSSHQDALSAGHFGRLNHHAAWCGLSSKVGDKGYIQIDLKLPTTIVAVATQGRPSWDNWVSSYKIKSSDDQSAWVTYKENNVEKVFKGNGDRNSIVKHKLSSVISGRYIQIVPLSYHGDNVCMRVEVYGCA